MENGPFIVDLNIRMVIFHSYITRGSKKTSKKTCYAYPPAIEYSNSTCPANGGSSIAIFDDRVLYPFFDSEIHWWRFIYIYINHVADVETFRELVEGNMCHVQETCTFGSKNMWVWVKIWNPWNWWPRDFVPKTKPRGPLHPKLEVPCTLSFQPDPCEKCL